MLMITLYAKQKKRHRCIEQSFGLCGRRRGWDVSREQHRKKKKENNIETCILSRVKQITSPGWMHETSGSDLVHWEDLEGSGGEGGGRDWDGEHM